MFIVHHEENNNTNMNFRMNDSGIHYYNQAEYLTFATKVIDNKKHYSKLQIRSIERSTELYRNFTYTSVAYYRWAIQSKQSKE